MHQRLSAIVPVLNEGVAVAGVVHALLSESDEVWVIDGGSADDTVARAAQAGAEVLQTGPGRGRQLRAGVGAATGDLLWFVHADTFVPAGAGPAIRAAALQAPWGCFDVRIDSADPRLRWTSWVMGQRARLTGSATGDMAIWCRRAFYERVGGFPDWPLLEDLRFTDAARRLAMGSVLQPAVGTSARRWTQEGVTRTMLRMLATRAGYRLGLPPAQLQRWYGAHPR